MPPDEIDESGYSPPFLLFARSREDETFDIIGIKRNLKLWSFQYRCTRGRTFRSVPTGT